MLVGWLNLITYLVLEEMAHVKTGTYSFQVALWDTHVMLLEVVQSHVLPFKSLLVQSYLQMKSYLMDQVHE
jgi:hypothetical protein